MKKLLGIAFVSMILTACSQPSDRPAPPPQGGPEMAQNTQVEAALKACESEVGKAKEQAKFDACMKAKGFERPQGQPGAQPPKSKTSK